MSGFGRRLQMAVDYRSPGGGGDSNTMLIGAASSPTGSNGGWDNLIAKSGMMQISRTYDTGMSTNLPNFYYGPKQISWFWSQGMTVAHTIKPNMSLLAARDATTMANLNTLLQSARGQKVWWCLWHEPENDTVGVNNSSNAFSLSDYIGAWQVFADTMHSYNEPGWQACWVMMSYTWKNSFLSGSPSFTPDSWYPGEQYVDIIGIDDYNEGSLYSHLSGNWQRWDSPGIGWGEPASGESLSPDGGSYYSPALLDWIDAKGKNYAICEFGTIRNLESAMGRRTGSGDPSTGPYTLDWWSGTYGGDSSKADWIKDYTYYHAVTVPANHTARCIAMMYFDYDGRKWKGDNTESWELFHTPGDVDYTAWGEMLTTYGEKTP